MEVSTFQLLNLSARVDIATVLWNLAQAAPPMPVATPDRATWNRTLLRAFERWLEQQTARRNFSQIFTEANSIQNLWEEARRRYVRPSEPLRHDDIVDASRYGGRIDWTREYTRKLRRAEQVALETLNFFLSPAQRAHYAAKSAFLVIGGETKALYLLFRSSVINIRRLLDGPRLQEMCVVLRADTPVEDLLLAQKILLEKDELRFVKVANIWEPHRDERLLSNYLTESLWNSYNFQPSMFLKTDSAGISTQENWPNSLIRSKNGGFSIRWSLSPKGKNLGYWQEKGV